MHIAFGDINAVKKEIGFAYDKVPFFRNSLTPALAAAIAAITSPADVTQIPATSKVDYRKNFPHGILADGRSVDDAQVSRMQSSGTSGDRLVTVMHSFKLADRMSNCLEVNPDLHFLLDEATIRTCRYAAPNCSDVECSNPYTTMQDRILPDGTLVLPVHHDLLTTPQTMLRVAFDEMHSYRPNLWYVDPMHMTYLILKARELGWEWSVPDKLAVLLSYAYATQALLRQLREFFGSKTPVAGVVAMSEFGFVGVECDQHTLHLNDKDFYLEFDNEEDDPDGVFELSVTSIGDRLCPHIRYRTNDLYRILPQCRCGSSMPAVAFEGRRKDVVTLANGKQITPRGLDQIVGAPLWIDVYQLTVQRQSHFVFRYKGNPEHQDAQQLAQLKQQLESWLDTSEVRMEAVEYFPFERGGKFQIIRAM